MAKPGLDFVCAITIQTNESTTILTGFFVSGNKILTSVRYLWKKTNPKITIRKLDEEDIHEVKICDRSNETDMVLLEVVGEYRSSTHGTLTRDGSLIVTKNIYTFAISPGISESHLKGSVGCSCKNVSAKNWENKQCRDYTYNSSKLILTYRKLGNFWNKSTLRDCTLENGKEFGGQLLCGLPVIECRGFNFTNNCVGCPVLKENGEIVGMFIESNSLRIALHVSVLQDFLDHVGV